MEFIWNLAEGRVFESWFAKSKKVAISYGMLLGLRFIFRELK